MTSGNKDSNVAMCSYQLSQLRDKNDTRSQYFSPLSESLEQVLRDKQSVTHIEHGRTQCTVQGKIVTPSGV